MTSSQQSLLTTLHEAIVKGQAQLGHAIQTLTALEKEIKQEPSSEEIDRKHALHLEGTRWNINNKPAHWIFLSGTCYFDRGEGRIAPTSADKRNHVLRMGSGWCRAGTSSRPSLKIIQSIGASGFAQHLPS